MEKQGVRENPIRRGGYSGGSAPTQPARFELASERAEEIQHNRTDPRRSGATPTMGVSEMRGGATRWIQDVVQSPKFKKGAFTKQALRHHETPTEFAEEVAEHPTEFKPTTRHRAQFVKNVKGGRAVPSAGVSQFRGGSDGRMVGAGKAEESDYDSDSSEEYEGGARDMEVLAREKAPRPAIRSGLSAQHSAEAKQMGHHLGKHLLSVRGGGFFDLFTKGIVEAGQEGQSVAEQTGEPSPSVSSPSSPDIMTTTEPPKMEGGFLSGAYEGMGKRRSARAEIVKKVMAEKKLGMIAASKYVKAHGLYKGGGVGDKRKADISSEELRARFEQHQREMEERDKMGKEFKRERAIDDVVRSGTPPRRPSSSPPSIKKKRARPSSPIAPPPSPVREQRRVVPSGVFDLTDLSAALPSGSGRGGKKRRAPAGPSDGRRKRAEIVKKVMAEKGMKMIEASKYVKAHGLY